MGNALSGLSGGNSGGGGLLGGITGDVSGIFGFMSHPLESIIFFIGGISLFFIVIKIIDSP